MDAEGSRHHRLQLRIIEGSALQCVEDLLAHQCAHPDHRAVQDQLQCGDHQPGRSFGPVRACIDVVDQLAEHRHVPALVAHLGECVVRTVRGRIAVHQLAQQQPVEDVLEPDPDRQDVRQFLPGQLAPLRRSHRFPDLGAVQGDDLRRQEELVRIQWRVPVQIDHGVIGLADRAEQ